MRALALLLPVLVAVDGGAARQDGGFRRLFERPLPVEQELDLRARARRDAGDSVRCGADLPTDVVFPPAREGERATVRVMPFPDVPGGERTATVDVTGRAGWGGRLVPFPDLRPELRPESRGCEVRVDGFLCTATPHGVGKQLLLALDRPDDAPVLSSEVSAGCFVTVQRQRWFRPDGAGFVADDGTLLTHAELERLRARVLASWPAPGETVHDVLEEPTAYLADLGITDERIEREVATIRATCVDERWSDPAGDAPAIPAELDGLFAPDALKHLLADYLLRRTNRGTDDWVYTVELPGDPWIWAGSCSLSPDLVPWYVIAGTKGWYSLDRDLSRALVELAPADSTIRERLDRQRDWQACIWSDPAVWSPVARRVNEALGRQACRRIAGWDELSRCFDVAVPPILRPGTEPRLPATSLPVARPGTIDTVLVRCDWDEAWTWRDVVAAYRVAETAASAQPWLARWKERSGGRISVFVPLRADHLSRYREVASELWAEAGLEGTPTVAVGFGFSVRAPDGSERGVSCGGGVLSTRGDLLILDSNATRGPLADEGLMNSRCSDTGRYAVVRRGGAPEIRTRAPGEPRGR